MLLSGREGYTAISNTATKDWAGRDHYVGEVKTPNAPRIVACVNACAGIPTEALDAGTIPALIVALRNLVAADNCGYERDTMRYEGLFETARRILAYLPDESQEAPCAP